MIRHVGDAGILGERVAAEQGEHDAAGVVEDDVVLRGASGLEAELLVEGARAGDIGDAEGDELQAGLHGGSVVGFAKS